MKRRLEFRLERVRRVRDLEERVARAERIHAEGVARAAEASRDAARELLERSRETLRKILAGTPDPRTVLVAQKALDGELAFLRRRSESARTLRTQAERIAAAHSERKNAARALEELRARAQKRHGAELEKLENAQLDEIAQRRSHARARADPRKGESPSRSAPAVADLGPVPAHDS